MSDVDAALDYADSVADWLVDLTAESYGQGDLESATRYAGIAASVLSRQNRTLCSPRLEASLLRVAEKLPTRFNGSRCDKPEDTCLHVLSEALRAGGHTAMVTRWILGDESGRRHSVALLSQSTPIPEPLAKAVSARGGVVHCAAADLSPIAKAVWLRELAYQTASQVALHVNPAEVVASIAFGVPGGPPVMIVNHAAHTFWVGTSIADLVLNCRGSDLEGVWAASHRGTRRFCTLPIPLSDGSGRTLEARTVRDRLGLPSDAVVLLTVGSWFKYVAVEGLDFVRTCQSVLENVPRAILLVVGFAGDRRWADAGRSTGNRIRTLGRVSQDELAALHIASDIFLEGFPFGTTTALLEAGLRGLPAVLSPAECPPPYGSDGVALDSLLTRPTSVPDYAYSVIRLAQEDSERNELGAALQREVRRHHTGLGWRSYLETATRALPTMHAIYSPLPMISTPRAVYEYWSRYLPKWSWGYGEALEASLSQAYAQRLKPKLSTGVLQACHTAKHTRAGRSIPIPLLKALCHYILPRIPAPWDLYVFGKTASLFRGAILSRLSRRAARWLKLVDEPRSAYEEYR